MKTPFPEKLFITGSDTGVGKTVVSAILTLGLNAHYWKPIQSGTDEGSDTEWVKKHTQLDASHFFSERYRLRRPFSPHLAAKMDNLSIDLEEIKIPYKENISHLILEGCGGLMVPLNERGDYLIDLINKWKTPTLIVTRSTLGTINHTLLTIEKLRQYSIPIYGIILNGPKNSENRKAIELYGNERVIGEIEEHSRFSPQILLKLFKSLKTRT